MTSPDLLARSLASPAAAGAPTVRDSAQPAHAGIIQPHAGRYASFGQALPARSSAGERVTWVRGDHDATAMFVKALADSYGAGISAAIAQELSLHPAPGRPLASRDIQRALEAARTSQQAIAGVNYLTLLRHSACADSREFRRVAHDLGVDTAHMGRDTRQKLDEALKRRFEQAGAAGASPISPDAARQMLKEELSLLTC